MWICLSGFENHFHVVGILGVLFSVALTAVTTLQQRAA